MVQIKYFFILSALVCLTACKSKDSGSTETPSDNSIDAARNFIRATLDGKFDEAKVYMLQDSLNINYLEVGKRSRDNATQDTKDGYRTASIRFHETLNYNDSTRIVIYSNSFKNDHDSLRVVKNNKQWLVDLKYLFEHDTDTISLQKTIIDTIK
jgi:hypothetical protein